MNLVNSAFFLKLSLGEIKENRQENQMNLGTVVKTLGSATVCKVVNELHAEWDGTAS